MLKFLQIFFNIKMYVFNKKEIKNKTVKLYFVYGVWM